MSDTGTFKKTMLKVGTYFSPDGKVNVTPKRLKHWAHNFKRLTRARQVVPMHWDHGNDLADMQPVPASNFSRSAKNSVGKLTDFQLARCGTKAELTFQTLDPVATRKVGANAVYVSPVIFPRWRDGAGNEYSDLITHLDLVNHPVDHSQSPAEPVHAVACALRMGLSQPFRLALDEPMEDDKKKYDDEDFTDDGVPGDPEVDAAGDLDNDFDEDGVEDFADADADGDGLDDVLEPEPEVMDEPEELDNGVGVGDLMLALADHGVILPDDTTEDNFLDRLRTALIAKKGDTVGDGGSEFDTGETIVADPQVATMSAYANKQYRGSVKRALKSLVDTGRATPAEAKEQAAALKSIKLSLNDQGKPKRTAVVDWIKSRKSLPPAAVWSPRERLRRLSSQQGERAVDHPQPLEMKSSDQPIVGQELEDLVSRLAR